METIYQEDIRRTILQEEFDEKRIPITKLIISAASSVARNSTERREFVKEAAEILSLIVKNANERGLIYYRTKLFDRARKAYQRELQKHGLNISFKVNKQTLSVTATMFQEI
jgi:hypothetical protein